MQFKIPSIHLLTPSHQDLSFNSSWAGLSRFGSNNVEAIELIMFVIGTIAPYQIFICHSKGSLLLQGKVLDRNIVWN